MMCLSASPNIHMSSFKSEKHWRVIYSAWNQEYSAFSDQLWFSSQIPNSWKQTQHYALTVSSARFRKLFMDAGNKYVQKALADKTRRKNCNSEKIMLKTLTKIPGDNDVIAAALTSGVIVRVVWGQHGSLWSSEMPPARSWEWMERADKTWNHQSTQGQEVIK